MVACCGYGSGLSWMVLVMIALMFGGCFFLMMRMRGKGIHMDCCTRSKSGTAGKHECPETE